MIIDTHIKRLQENRILLSSIFTNVNIVMFKIGLCIENIKSITFNSIINEKFF